MTIESSPRKRIGSVRKISPRLFLAGIFLLAAFYFFAVKADDLVKEVPFEDAVISYRYADNLAAGRGLNYNPDWPPVEGYSNFFTVVLLAGLKKLGMDIPSAGVLQSYLFGFLALVLLLLPAMKKFGLKGILFPALVILWPHFRVACLNGLETTQYAAALIAVALLLGDADTARKKGRRFALGIICAWAALVRIDFPLILFSFVTASAVAERKNLKSFFDFWLPVAAGFAVVYLPYTIFRWTYFETLIPNVFRSKNMNDGVSTVPQLLGGGVLYLLTFLTRNQGAAVLLGFCVAVVALKKPSSRTTPFLFACGVLAIVVSGGEWRHSFYRYRYFVPLSPLLVLWFVESVPLSLEGWKKELAVPIGAAVVAGALTAVLSSWAPPLSIFQMPPFSYSVARNVRSFLMLEGGYRSPFALAGMHKKIEDHPEAAAARWVRDHTRESDVVFTGQAGHFGYYVGRSLVDTCGLVTSWAWMDPRSWHTPEMEHYLDNRQRIMIVFFNPTQDGEDPVQGELKEYFQSNRYALDKILAIKDYPSVFAIWRPGLSSEDTEEPKTCLDAPRGLFCFPESKIVRL